MVVRTKNAINRHDGTVIKFNENAAVIITNNKVPRGTRIFGPVSQELKQRKFDKIVSLVSEVL